MSEVITRAEAVIVEALYDRCWTALRDTERMNRLLGLPGVNYGPIKFDGKGFTREATAKVFGHGLRWKESPFEWSEGDGYSILREFIGSPLQRVFTGVKLKRLEGQTEVNVFSNVQPSKPAYTLLARYIAQKTVADVVRYIKRIEPVLREGDLTQLPVAVTSSPDRALLQQRMRKLIEHHKFDSELLILLADYLCTASDEEVARLSPYRLAAEWKKDPKETLRLMLYATKHQVTSFVWDLVCPTCRVRRQTLVSLDQIEAKFHCELCASDYQTSLEERTEVAFKVAEDIRQIPAADSCSGGPGQTPQIRIQKIIPPKGVREFSFKVTDDKNQLRVIRHNHICQIHLSQDADEKIAEIQLDMEGFVPFQIAVKPGPIKLSVKNRSKQALVCVVEERGSDTLATKGIEVYHMPEFRQFFPHATLAPGCSVPIQDVSLFFAELKSSLQDYEDLGDQALMARVSDFRTKLEKQVYRRGGIVVRQMDEVFVAAFLSSALAFKAALEVQQDALKGHQKLDLSIGIHAGPAMTTGSAHGTEYFGHSLKVAARLAHLGHGHDILISDTTLARDGADALTSRYKVHRGEPVQDDQLAAIAATRWCF